MNVGWNQCSDSFECYCYCCCCFSVGWLAIIAAIITTLLVFAGRNSRICNNAKLAAIAKMLFFHSRRLPFSLRRSKAAEAPHSQVYVYVYVHALTVVCTYDHLQAVILRWVDSAVTGAVRPVRRRRSVWCYYQSTNIIFLKNQANRENDKDLKFFLSILFIAYFMGFVFTLPFAKSDNKNFVAQLYAL